MNISSCSLMISEILNFVERKIGFLLKVEKNMDEGIRNLITISDQSI